MLNIAVQILHQAKSHHHPHRSAQKRHVESEANNACKEYTITR
jgi:hypothetical protein